MCWAIVRDIRAFSRKVCCGVFTCLCAGPALFIGGIVLLTVSSIDRTTNVNTYNAAVSTWEDGMGYLTWLGIPQNSFRITADATVNASQMLNIPDSPAVDSGSDVDTYSDRVKYGFYNGANSQTTVLQPRSASTGTVLTQSISLTSATTGSLRSESVVLGRYATWYPCFSSDSRTECANRCRYNFNSVARSCSAYFSLSEVCYVVDPDTMLLDASFPGCVAGNTNVPSSVWNLLTWPTNDGTVMYNYAVSLSPPGTLSFNSVPFSVRSSDDPYVTALSVTNGNPGYFGITRAGRVGTGVGLLVAGGVLTAVVLAAVCIIIRMVRRRNRPVVHAQTTLISPISSGTGPGGAFQQPVYQPVPMAPGYAPAPMAPGYAPPPGYPYHQPPAASMGGGGVPPSYAPGYAPGYAPPSAPGYAPAPHGYAPPPNYPAAAPSAPPAYNPSAMNYANPAPPADEFYPTKPAKGL